MRAIVEEVSTEILREQFVPDHLFIYVEKGAIRVFDGDKNLVVKTGQAFIARKNSLVKYELLNSKEGFEPVLFCFDEPFLKEFEKKHAPARYGRSQKNSFVEIGVDKMLDSFMQSIKPYYRSVMALDEAFEDLKYEELLIILLKKQPGLSSFLFDFEPPAKVGLEAFMNKNYIFNVGLQQFATLTGRSLSAFKRDFNEIFQEPPSQWLVRKRLQQAYVLLDKKKQKPADIYLDLGFKSLSHFSVAFKKQFHCTPTELLAGR